MRIALRRLLVAVGQGLFSMSFGLHPSLSFVILNMCLYLQTIAYKNTQSNLKQSVSRQKPAIIKIWEKEKTRPVNSTAESTNAS